MIKIQEISPPRKLSGISSLLITFDYNAEVIECIKSLDTFYYHKKDYTWEVPSYDLAKILDLLTFYDNIQINLLVNQENQNKANSELNNEEIEQFKLKPYKHQIEGINFGLMKNKWLLLDSMGLGKTNEIIWYAETLKRRGLIDHCFIICGVDSLRQNWKKEIQKFSTESVLVLGEKISKKGNVSYTPLPDRAKQLKDSIDAFFVITNIASIRSDAIVEAFNKSTNKFGLIAVDEIHRCLSGDTVINTSIGNIKLEDLINLNKLPMVVSYNEGSNINELKQITDFSVSIPTEPVVELTIKDNNYLYTLTCTESHEIYTINRGWVKAKDLTDSDNIKIS